MKKFIPFLIIALILLLSASASSYEIQVIGNIPLSDNLTGISVNSATGIAAAVSNETKTLYIIDVFSGIIVRKIPLDITPSSISIDVGKNAVAISSAEGTVQYVDLETGSLVNTISTGIRVHCLVFSNNLLYIGKDNGITVMDSETGNIIKEATLGSAVMSIDADSGLGYLLTTIEGKDGLSFYNMNTLEPLTVIKTGKNHSGVAVNPSTHIALLTNKTDNSISIISIENKSLIETIPFNENPGAISIDPVRNIALIGYKAGVAIVKLENPIPMIDTLIPESSQAGEPGLTLTIKGSGFIGKSKARFDLKELSTLFEDNYNLKAAVPSEELLYPRDVPVTVINTTPGGGMSNSLTFKVMNPVPQVEVITPDTVALTEPPANIRVRGKNFLFDSVINLNGKYLKTRFISSILLEAQLDISDIRIPARYPVTVINPSPVSLTSNVVFLSVVENASLIPIPTDGDGSKEEPAKPTGTFTGRILNTQKEPIEGITIQIKSLTVRTNSDGYFMLENVPSGKQLLLIHGPTATASDSHYPTIPLSVDIEAGIINEMPFQIYLHRQKNYNFKEINPNEDTVLTDPEIPGFELRIPKGVKITGWDGQPNLRISVRTVPTDRLPVKPLPHNAYVRTVYMFYFDKIGGGTPDQPIPIKSPNDLGLLPGEKAVLWYYDESPIEGEAPNDWAIAGTGTVTPDGKYIVSDPGVGIPKFCCGATAWGGTSSGLERSCPEGNCGLAGDPVDVATGYFIHSKTDLRIPGIIPINIKRYYRNRESGSAVTGSEGLGVFGKGTYFEYDWWMGAYGADGQINETNPTMLKLIKPGNYQYTFPKQPDGTFINATDPEFRGAVATYDATYDTRTLRMRDGTKYKFDYHLNMTGELIEISDRNDNKLTFTRRPRSWYPDMGGYIYEIKDTEGNVLVTFSQTYTGNFHRTDSITDNSGRTVNYSYETDPFSDYPRLKTVIYPDGSNISYGYDSSGRMNTVTDQRGIVEVTNEYNSDHRIITQTHADGGIYTFNYTIAGGHVTETSMTAPNGGITTWRLYDEPGGTYRDGYIIRRITPDGIYIYEREVGTNLLKSVTDPLGRKMTYTYYSNGLINTMTDNLSNVTSYEYEANYGLPTKIKDAIGQSTGKTVTFTYTYDSNNKITKTEIRDQLLNLTTINYNTYGMPTSVKDPNNNTTTFLYENTNRPAELTKIVTPLTMSSE